VSALEIYLQNHEAAARAGVDLSRRAAFNQRRQAHGPELKSLRQAIEEDRSRLRTIMSALQVPSNPLLAVALQMGERVARLKPNGRVLRRSPLSDLIEIEGLVDAVTAKRSGWLALAAARLPADVADQVAQLITRADGQLARLAPIHATVAATVLT
jgi:hypothetical protein